MIFGNDQYHATAAAINSQKYGIKWKEEDGKNVKLIIINGKYTFWCGKRALKYLK